MSWQSKLHKCTIEDEYIFVTEASNESLWFKYRFGSQPLTFVSN
jgi:hypothetical protein